MTSSFITKIQTYHQFLLNLSSIIFLKRLSSTRWWLITLLLRPKKRLKNSILGRNQVLTEFPLISFIEESSSLPRSVIWYWTSSWVLMSSRTGLMRYLCHCTKETDPNSMEEIIKVETSWWWLASLLQNFYSKQNMIFYYRGKSVWI